MADCEPDQPDPGDPPGWWLDRSAAGEAERHEREDHAGQPCDCPPPEIIYAEPPF